MSEFESRTFDNKELQIALGVAITAAESVAPELRRNFGRPEYLTKNGDERSWVTPWDNWAQEVIIDELQRFNPEIGFKAEEDDIDTKQEVYWTIDPIDGTSHFVRGNDYCTTMIALVDHGVPVVGVINDFMRQIRYSAVSKQGAFAYNAARNELSAPLTSTRRIESAYVEIYTDETSEQGSSLRKKIEETGAYLLRTAACGHMMISIARGGMEGLVALNSPYATEWDVAPGALLIHEAGGLVQNINSDRFTVKDPDFIATNPLVFSALKEIVKAV
jgi:fructose-1,6-bisphosphatase/inositol monophosphatase family enzyme